MEIGKIIRQTRLDAGLTLKSVEAATGIPASNQSKIELGDNLAPGFYSIAVLAEFYRLSLDGIYESTKNKKENPSTVASAKKHKYVPILSYCEAGEWVEHVPEEYDFDVIVCPFRCSNDTFALRVSGDSMTSLPGSRNSFPEGSIIFVDPKKEPRHNSLVVARIEGTNEVTFKRLHSEGGYFLQPLNPQYPVMPINQDVIVCGVVIGSIQECP